MSGLLNWALVGLDRLLKNDGFSYSPSTEETKNEWLRKSDSCQAFIMDCIGEDPESKISKVDFRREYALYCRKYKLKISSDKPIKYALTTILGAIDDRVMVNCQQIACWTGIKFSKGSEGSDGFSTLGKIVKSPIGSKRVATLTTFTNCSTCKSLLNKDGSCDFCISIEKKLVEKQKIAEKIKK